MLANMSAQLPSLPPGLTPVQAGRFGLWLLGKRKHLAAQRRTWVSSSVLDGNRIPQRFAKLVCRWTVSEYPGLVRAFSSLLGVSLGSGKVYLYRSGDLPHKQAKRLLELSREYRAEWDALIVDLEALVASRSKRVSRRRGGKTG